MSSILFANRPVHESIDRTELGVRQNILGENPAEKFGESGLGQSLVKWGWQGF
ncbi:MAG: hypothetical protein ACOH5I_26260 [Oligoflexus sp.]